MLARVAAGRDFFPLPLLLAYRKRREGARGCRGGRTTHMAARVRRLLRPFSFLPRMHARSLAPSAPPSLRRQLKRALASSNYRRLGAGPHAAHHPQPAFPQQGGGGRQAGPIFSPRPFRRHRRWVAAPQLKCSSSPRFCLSLLGSCRAFIFLRPKRPAEEQAKKKRGQRGPRTRRRRRR